MFARLCAFAAAVLFCAQVSWGQTPHSAPKAPAADDETGQTEVAALSPSLAGTWKAKTEKLPLTGEFNEKVWGKNATSVRDVTLTVRPSGAATLTISRKVLDARGRTVPGSASVEQADVEIGAATPALATRMEHAVKVVKAERRYPDNPDDRWPLENLRVNVVSFTDGDGTVEVRFEPADGQGALSELLTKQRVVARKR